jgi:hypothetical protein
MPKKSTTASKTNREEEDRQLKRELLALAKSGAPRPKRGTRLGNALRRFTTPPSPDRPKRPKLSEVDRLMVSAQKAHDREANRGRALPRQRPNHLAKGERHSR